jgi:hypothetical protein
MELCVPLAIHSRCDGGKGRRYPAGGDWLRAFFTGLLASAAAATVVVVGEADAAGEGAGGAGADWSAAAGGGGRPVAAAAAAAAVMSGAGTLRGTTAAVNDASVAASITGTPSGITWKCGTVDGAAEEEVAAPSAEGAAASAGDAAAAAGTAAAAAAAACAASVAQWGAPSARVVVCVAFAARECMRRCCGGGCGDRQSDGAVAVCIVAGMDDARRCTAPFALPASALVTLAARCHMATLMLMK